MLLVSVGGLKLKSWPRAARFFRATYRAYKQAKCADGCVHVDLFRAEGRYFVISVWETPRNMAHYAKSGVHKEAMARAFETTKEARNFCFAAKAVPTRKKSLEMWKSGAK